ncbi:hypothetical protein Vadar_034211 [Vaccinium darrowii]|uniref:Uncharacterized protein n=1 Tax=Vaccinium darrowii TaxID=229202 RepID=A0ACB7Z2G8_9ERIC|nr:hypothetical protein Vadar_034211 [Vaccinium darrowii]
MSSDEVNRANLNEGNRGIDALWGAFERQQQQAEIQQQQLTEIHTLLVGLNLNSPRVQQRREPRVNNNPGHVGNPNRRVLNNPIYEGDSTDDEVERIAMQEEPRDGGYNNYDQVLFHQYQRCQQGTRPVHEYVVEFQRLSSRNDLPETEGQLVARFVDGLRTDIQDAVNMQPVHTLLDAIQLATRAEFQLNRKGNYRNQATTRTFSSSLVHN